MKTRILFAAAVVVAATAGVARAAPVTLTTGGTYDENVNQANAVDTNASGNPLASALPTDVAGFTTVVGAAFAAGQGGVVNFDMPNGAAANVNNQTEGFVASFASGTKALPVTATTAGTNDNQFNFTTFSSLTPISGSSTDSKGLIATTSTATAMRLTLGSITGGSTNEAVTQVGFTVLSRDTKGQGILVEAFADGNTTPFASDAEAIAAGKTVDDTFFSFTAPAGSAITSIRIGFDTDNVITSDDRLGIDDFGFVTSIVPEPGAMASIGLAGLLLLRRRRMSKVTA